MLKFLALYLTGLAVVEIASLAGDLIYYKACDAYPANVIEEGLLWPFAFPIRAAAQVTLRKMRYYPKETVDKITGQFATFTFYIVCMGIQSIFLVYTARESRFLGMLSERGSLGLGVHYGLGQFDEIINHEAIKQRKEKPSKFVEDGQLPLAYPDDPEVPFGYLAAHDYGAFSGQQATQAKGPSVDLDHWVERMKGVEEELGEAKGNLAAKQKELKDAQAEMRQEKAQEAKLELDAEANFREQEISYEKKQERRAEELAEEKADEARRRAESQGKSAQEAIMAANVAYQRALITYHKEMIQLAKSRTLHEHYRHTERLEEFKHMEEEVSHKVQEAGEEVDKAQVRLEQVENSKASLENEKAVLIHSGQWVEPIAENSAQEPPDQNKELPSVEPPDLEQPGTMQSQWLPPHSNPSIGLPPPTLPWASTPPAMHGPPSMGPPSMGPPTMMAPPSMGPPPHSSMALPPPSLPWASTPPTVFTPGSAGATPISPLGTAQFGDSPVMRQS
jgi:hypothetical protein